MMNKTQFLSKMKDSNIYLHVTKDLNHNGIFNPRIPEDRLLGWNEDSKTPRVCVAEDLNGCLTGASIDENIFVKVFFVDVKKLGLENDIIKWEELYQKDLVTDAVYTKEAWILKDFKVDEEDSAIIALNNLDEEDLYLVNYRIKMKALMANMDEVDFCQSEYNCEPNCITKVIVDEDNLLVLDNEAYDTFHKTTMMVEGQRYYDDLSMDDNYDMYEYDIRELKEFKSKYEISYLNEDGSRKVFSFGECAIKIPKSEDGELQSQTELNIYKKSGKSLSILNPTYKFVLPDTVAQPLLTPFDESYAKKYNSILEFIEDNDFEDGYLELVEKEIQFLINEYGLIKKDLLNICNWGIRKDYEYNEKVYLFNYGVTEEIFEEYFA